MDDDGVRGWSANLRADLRRQGEGGSCRWLKEEKDTRLNPNGGGGENLNSNSNADNLGVNMNPVNSGGVDGANNSGMLTNQRAPNTPITGNGNFNVNLNGRVDKGKVLITGLDYQKLERARFAVSYSASGPLTINQSNHVHGNCMDEDFPEKKRCRELEEMSTQNNPLLGFTSITNPLGDFGANMDSDHFLSAGPGSQAYQDQ